jgi:hypothetical protein
MAGQTPKSAIVMHAYNNACKPTFSLQLSSNPSHAPLSPRPAAGFVDRCCISLLLLLLLLLFLASNARVQLVILLNILAITNGDRPAEPFAHVDQVSLALAISVL